MIRLVTYVQFAILLVEANSVRVVELQRIVATCANCSSEFTCWGKLLNTVIVVIHYISTASQPLHYTLPDQSVPLPLTWMHAITVIHLNLNPPSRNPTGTFGMYNIKTPLHSNSSTRRIIRYLSYSFQSDQLPADLLNLTVLWLRVQSLWR